MPARPTATAATTATERAWGGGGLDRLNDGAMMIIPLVLLFSCSLVCLFVCLGKTENDEIYLCFLAHFPNTTYSHRTGGGAWAILKVYHTTLEYDSILSKIRNMSLIEKGK